jgi:hypothetical protein
MNTNSKEKMKKAVRIAYVKGTIMVLNQRMSGGVMSKYTKSTPIKKRRQIMNAYEALCGAHANLRFELKDLEA